ncbi:MAG TPA: hypothetical protein VF405_05720 [Gammaproteobacteria bacterium]
MNTRERVLEYLELLAQPSRQIDYETGVLLGDSHGELVRWFCDDLFRPKSQQFLDAFAENEIKDLARLYGLLIESRRLRASSLADLLREPEWRRIARFANELVATIDAGGEPTAANSLPTVLCSDDRQEPALRRDHTPAVPSPGA